MIRDDVNRYTVAWLQEPIYTIGRVGVAAEHWIAVCRWLLLLLALVLPGRSAIAADDAASISPTRFLEAFCIHCHSVEQAEGDFRLDVLPNLDATQQSQVWQRIRERLAAEEMPPEEADQPSEARRVRLLDWIEQTYGVSDRYSGSEHWAFQGPARPALPRLSPAANPVDTFIERALQDRDLTMSPLARRATLLRRASLDLIGLPPTPDELQAFLADPAPLEQAFQRVLDRLLASPRYGERWAQHWLDTIRWAETVGFETNLERPHAWPYRDWVIKAFNSDKPYDRFVAEQLVGDTVGADAALGFLVAGPANLPGQIGRDVEAMRQARQDELDETIRTVSQALFGLTIGCARCHDHKFDPIRQRDYYSMQAIFAGLRYGDRRLRGPENDRWAEEVPALRRQLSRLQGRLERQRRDLGLRPPLRDVQNESFPPLLGDAVRMEISVSEQPHPSLYEFEVWSHEEEPRNVAASHAGGRASASSFMLANQTRHFDNLIDGSTDRRQAFPWQAAQPGAVWLQVSFPQPVSIDTVRWHAGFGAPVEYQIQVRTPAGQWVSVADTSDRLPRISDPRKPEQITLQGVSQAEVRSLYKVLQEIRRTSAELTRLSAGPQVFAASFVSDPEATWLLKRGDPMQRADVVPPSVPIVLQERVAACLPVDGEQDRRRMLAMHLADPDHPLTARVIVNRLWQYHFGTGLVATPSDFGRRGSPPSHPKLLDWLATELVRQDWSLKRMHRLMMSSRVYRQQSLPRKGPLAIDAESRLLWRFPPRRLAAEAIRDSILSVSNQLNTEMVGPGFDFFNQRGGLTDYRPLETFQADGWRRMVYAHKVRMQSIDIFGEFDCPDAGQMTPKRNSSITPLQSLALFNSPFLARQSTFFARHIEKVWQRKNGAGTRDVAGGPREQTHRETLRGQVELAIRHALGRAPAGGELDRLTTLAHGHGLDQVCRVLFNSSEFLYLP